MNSDVMGVCALPGHESSRAQPSLWESRRGKEPIEEMEERHRQARFLCQRCPLLDPCERALSDMELKSIPIDGVMAGRYGDVAYGSLWEGDVQRTCAVCGELMNPQRKYRKRTPPVARNHMGEGLCEECFPIFSRKNRSAAVRNLKAKRSSRRSA